jgi:hypothetical protein
MDKGDAKQLAGLLAERSTVLEQSYLIRGHDELGLKA